MSDLLVSRRDFMKGTGAVVLAAACSGLMTGCSGGSSGSGFLKVESEEKTAGDFNVKITEAKAAGQATLGEENGMVYVFDPKVHLTFTGVGFSGVHFSDVFSATINGEKMTLVNGDESVLATDFGLEEGKVKDTVLKAVSHDYCPEFQTKNSAAYNAFESGAGAVVLSVTFNKQAANYTITYDKTNKKYIAK